MLLSLPRPLAMPDSPPIHEAAREGLPPDVLAAQRGDEAAFESLYRSHVGRVYALCLRMTGNPAEAETATQEVFTRAWEKLGSYRGESALAGWLRALTVNFLLMRHRATARRLQRVETTDDLDRLDPAAPGAHPEARMDLERAIRALPDGARVVFVLHDVEGYSHAEIAEELGIAENTCKAQLHRAKRLLREVLDERA